MWGAGGLQEAAKTDALKAQTRLSNLAADAQQVRLDAIEQNNENEQLGTQYIQQLMQGKTSPGTTGITNNPADQPKSMADAFDQTAQHLFSVGAPNVAMEYYKKGQLLRKNTLDNTKATLDAQKQAFANRVSQADMVGRVLGNATTQEQFDQGLQTLQQSGLFTPEELGHLSKIPVHSAAQQYLREQALSVKQQNQEKLDQAKADETKLHDQALESNDKARTAIARQALNETKWRDRHQQKTGNTARAPSASMLKAVDTAVKTQILKDVDVPADEDDFVQAGIQSIASSAQQLIRDNKGLDMQTAINRAVLQSKQRGDWDIVRNSWVSRHMPGGEDSTLQGVTTTGHDVNNPTMVPAGQAKTFDYKEGHWYISPNGKVGMYKDGKMWVK